MKLSSWIGLVGIATFAGGFPPPIISRSVEMSEVDAEGNDLGPAAPVDLVVVGGGVGVNVPPGTDALAVGVFDEGAEEPCCVFGGNLPEEGWLNQVCSPPCAPGKHKAVVMRTPAGVGTTTTVGVTNF